MALKPLQDTEKLIDALATNVRPVRRLQPPHIRAAIWLIAVLSAMALVVWAAGHYPEFTLRVQDRNFALQIAGIFGTAVAGIVAAFHLSIPGYSRSWLYVPLPPLILWLASSGYGCYRDWISRNGDQLALGISAECFSFLVAASLPLALGLYIVLRRSVPLETGPVSLAGGLGIAGLSATILMFLHPHDVTVIDLGAHAIAIGLVVVLSRYFGSRAFGDYTNWRIAGVGP